MNKLIPFFATVIFLLAGCSGTDSRLSDYDVQIYSPRYASGFEIIGARGRESTILKVSSPWQNSSAESNERLVFIRRNDESLPTDFEGSVIDSEAFRVVCMSSSHVAMLNVLGESERVVGASGVRFLCNERFAHLAEVGYDQVTDYEMILSLQPDVVLLYGIAGPSPLENKLRSLGVPFAYVGEYLEDSPLAKAEWLVAVAEIVGCRDLGEEIFSEIPIRYNAVKEKIARFATSRPKVMLNTPYGDSWFMPASSSYMVRLIEDACGDYVYKSDSTNRSLPVSLEEAVVMTSEADYWLNAYVPSLSSLRDSYPKCADSKCVTSGNVFNCDKRTNAAGGNDFWESGVLMPDVVLYDLGVILHPGFGSDLYFYRRLK